MCKNSAKPVFTIEFLRNLLNCKIRVTMFKKISQYSFYYVSRYHVVIFFMYFTFKIKKASFHGL